MSSLRAQLLPALVLLLVAVLGLPQVWAGLRSGDLGVEVVFYPLLGAVFGWLTVSRR